MKDRAAGADIVFMPYNYLVDEKIRENFDINFKNAVIIFDEAHNITQSCEEVSSFSVDTNSLEKVITELRELQDVKSQNTDLELLSKDEGIQ